MNAFVDLVVRIRAFDERLGGYPVEADVDDEREYTGLLRLDTAALQAANLDRERYGLALFDALFNERIRTAYDVCTGRAEAQTGGHLRLRLRIDEDASELHAIPWERLYHSDDGTGVPLAISNRMPFSRYVVLEQAVPKAASIRPIRVLFAVANPTGLPPGLVPIDVAAHVEALHEALGELSRANDVEVTVLPGRTGLPPDVRARLERDGYEIRQEPTTLTGLLRAMPGHHVLHLVAHGRFNRRRRGEAALFLENEDGGWEPATDAELVPRFASADPLPRLVFLAACESAARDASDHHPFVGLGPRIVAAGVPAVIAMQDAVPAELVRSLTSDFYRNLTEHGLVDLALNEARLLLYNDEGADWSIPVLFSQLHDGRLFVPGHLANRTTTETAVIHEDFEHGLPADRLSQPPPVPRRLPAPVLILPRAFPGLLGRELEIARGLRAVRDGTPIEFHAEPGTGKTSLVRGLAHRVRAVAPDGVVHLAAAGRPAEDLLQFLFDAIYETEGSFKPSEALLRKYLQDPRVVYSLDDADLDREQVQALLDGAPQCGFVLTAERQNLWGDGDAVRLGGLSADAALTLFERRAERDLTGRERAAAADLCAALGGHPLHIVQAAELVRDGRRSVEELTAAVGAAPPGRALAGEIEASLGDEERRALRVLAALDGAAVSPDHVGAIAGVAEPAPVLERLERLAIVKAASPRYRLSEPPAGALREALGEDLPEEEVVEHFAAWGERHRRSPARLVADVEAMTAALDRAHDLGRDRAFLSIARSVEVSLVAERRWDAWERLLGRQLDVATRAGDAGARAYVLHQLGTRALGLDDADAARTLLSEALDLRREVGDRRGAEVTQHNLEQLPPLPPPPPPPPPSPPPRPRPSPAILLLIVALVLGGIGGAYQVVRREPAPPVARATVSPARLQFEAVMIGNTADKPVTLRNTGSGDLRVTSVGRLRGDFTVLSDRCGGALLTPNQACEIMVRFSPTRVGGRFDRLAIVHDAPGGGRDIELSGVGVRARGPQLSISSRGLRFGTVVVGRRRESDVRMSNVGSAQLTIVRIRVMSNEFGLVRENCTAGPLPASGSCTVTLAFAPADVGRRTADLEVLDGGGVRHRRGLAGVGAPALPDLVVPLVEAGDPGADNPTEDMAVPVTIDVVNRGHAPAGRFFVATVTVYGAGGERVPARFRADETEMVDPGNGAVPITKLALAPGRTVRFTGWVLIPDARPGDQVTIVALADACPPRSPRAEGPSAAVESCGIEEIREDNNEGTSAPVTVPGEPEGSPSESPSPSPSESPTDEGPF